MNKKAQATFFIGVVIGLFVFMNGVFFIEHFKTDITQERINLDCASPSLISDGTKLLCLGLDTQVPYYILVLVSIAVGFIPELTKRKKQ